MSPRSNDSNASSSKQKKKQIESPPPIPSISLLDSPSSPDALLADLDSTPAPVDPIPAVSVATTQNVRVGAGSGSPASAAADSSSQAPRQFVASTFKPVSAIDSVTSTISAISQHANRGISSLIAAHSTSTNPASPAFADTTALRTDGSVSPIYDAFHNAGSTPDPAHIEAALNNAGNSGQASQSPAPRVLWSRWGRLPLKSHPLKFAPLLISYYDDGCLQALLLQDRTISELLSLPNAADVLLDASTSNSSLARPQLLTALVRPPSPETTDPQLLIVLQEPDNATRLLAYSLASHQLQASVQLQHHLSPIIPEAQQHDQRRNLLWPQVQAQCNHNYLVLSFAAPASIHVLSTATLEYIRSPILDVAAVSLERPPPFSLSSRLLAFACTANKDISPIRSDMRKVSNAAYHDPSRSFAAMQSDASVRVGEMRDNLFETSAHVGDAARRIRGGVMTGVRTLGEWGSSYWPQAGSPPVGASAFSPPQSSLLSQSAPHTASHPPRSASSASSSPMLLAADGGRAAKRLSTGAPIAADTAAGSSHHPHTIHAGCVRVIDLASDARHICTFAPSSHAVTLVSFSPCGRLILTADTLGHAFHVFDLPLTGSFGNAASPPSASTVLHRYKLMRGITTADVVQAQWTPDAQWLAVGTHSGTVHIYAVNPFGGVPSIANHVHTKIRNPHVLQPCGLSLSSVARSIRPPAPPQQNALSKATTVPGSDVHPASSTDTQVKIGAPCFLLVNHAARAIRSENDVSSPFELLTADARSVSVTLHSVRCWSTHTRVSSNSVGSQDVHAAGTDSKLRSVPATSPRTSGLSQMMRKAGEGLLTSQQAPRLQAECVRVALWDQLSPDAGSTTKHSVAALADHMTTSGLSDKSSDSMAKTQASVAKAEIETYSQSPAMLPSSIFLSRQTFFHARARSNKPASSANSETKSLRCIQRRGSRPIQVRRTARLVSREPSSEEPSSFDDSLAGALDQMSFNPESLPPRSASAHIPSFPQGQRGRSAGWTAGSSIPIRIVAGGLGGIYRAGKELGRGVEMAKRRTSGASGGAAPEESAEHAAGNAASISFDSVDDVDLLGEDEDLAQSARHHYRSRHGARSQTEHTGSTQSDLSLLSGLRSDEPGKGSQPSSAETPSTRFSEAEDGLADTDECDWDAIEASRSPAAPAASLFDGQHHKKQGLTVVSEANGSSMDDDFTVGMLEEDSEEATLLHSQSSGSPAKDSVKSRAGAPKELVYALPSGGSTRSSLLSQSSSGKATTVEALAEVKAAAPRDSSPSNSEGGDSASQRSAGSGMLCEGSKETHTIDSPPFAVVSELEASAQEAELKAIKPKPISTSGGGKKKKKGGR